MMPEESQPRKESERSLIGRLCEWWNELKLPTSEPPSHSTHPTSLTASLKSILNAIKNSLAEGELTSKEYHRIIFEEGKKAGIFSHYFNENRDLDATALASTFDRWLQLRRYCGDELHGVYDDYRALPTTPITERASRDVIAYRGLEIDTRKALTNRFGTSTVHFEDFKAAIEDLLSAENALLDDRRAALHMRLLLRLQPQFNISYERRQERDGDGPSELIKPLLHLLQQDPIRSASNADIHEALRRIK